jgi:penicillin amidase
MKVFKWVIGLTLVLALIIVSAAYFVLSASLPTIEASVNSNAVSNQASLSRDALGTAIIHAETEYDAGYLLGYAHAQDRLFQLDLLRRQSAGELSELVGKAAIEVDKRHKFHQLKKTAKRILSQLPAHEKSLINAYTKGVNDVASNMSAKPFEYFLLSAEFRPWTPVDSLMVVYSMYLDLQRSQTEIDFSLTVLNELYSASMYDFFTLPSNYQAAIDQTIVQGKQIEIPVLKQQAPNEANDSDKPSVLASYYDTVPEQPDYGSNNWAVAGALSQTQSGLLSNDMHLGLRLPTIWYKAQLNYKTNGKPVQVTGVTLPGLPAVIVGANKHIAWGFTNAGIDNADWIELSDNTPTSIEQETINIADGDSVVYDIEVSQFGPVRSFNGKKYALKWVAHQDYAINSRIADMAKMQSVEEALTLSEKVRMPVQNMVVVDAKGDVAWQLTGAIAGRTAITRHAISEENFSDLWAIAETQPANLLNPENGRVWSANARVTGVEDLARFGDGGYALGARQQQIMMQLMQQDQFTEQSFYDMQLDNRALFLIPWHSLLVSTLENSPQKYASDIETLKNWQACACSDSVGYTLVRRFRSTLINQLIDPITQTFKDNGLSATHLLRGIEPSIWAILQQQPRSWLPNGFDNYDKFISTAYDTTKTNLLIRYHASNEDMSNLAWGKVNALKVKHPFSSQLGALSEYFDMVDVEGFGDSYLPAVQSTSFGASQRLIVSPGNLDKAILTIPGGQSGHVLSDFYRSGFSDYAKHKNTSLLPSKILYTIQFMPIN